MFQKVLFFLVCCIHYILSCLFCTHEGASSFLTTSISLNLVAECNILWLWLWVSCLPKINSCKLSNEFVKCKLPMLILRLNFANGPKLSIANHQSQIAKRKWSKPSISNEKSLNTNHLGIASLLMPYHQMGFYLIFRWQTIFMGG